MAQTFQLSRQSHKDNFAQAWTPPATAQDAVTRLQSMNRKELLKLFLSCEAPSDLTDVQGDWDGCLLENNQLTSVTRFLTNGLFGRGRVWNGKAFLDDQTGVNRFRAKQNDDKMEYQHEFDYSLEKSGIGSSCSLSLAYSKYQFPLSLWHSMTDELRCVPVGDNEQEAQVLIGFGSMAWSGRKLNSSPFCIWRAQDV